MDASEYKHVRLGLIFLKYIVGGLNTPTGHRPKAQGCEAPATLGQRPMPRTTPTGLCQTS
jgi:hypothetical protein